MDILLHGFSKTTCTEGYHLFVHLSWCRDIWWFLCQHHPHIVPFFATIFVSCWCVQLHFQCIFHVFCIFIRSWWLVQAGQSILQNVWNFSSPVMSMTVCVLGSNRLHISSLLEIGKRLSMFARLLAFSSARLCESFLRLPGFHLLLKRVQTTLGPIHKRCKQKSQ